MKKLLLALLLVTLIGAAAGPVFAQKKSNVGEEKFKALCAVCHPDGGNIVNPKKTLHKKDLEANNIKTADDIINVMRKPGPGMNVFSQKTVPDKDARAIAEYIMKTFK